MWPLQALMLCKMYVAHLNMLVSAENVRGKKRKKKKKEKNEMILAEK